MGVVVSNGGGKNREWSIYTGTAVYRGTNVNLGFQLSSLTMYSYYIHYCIGKIVVVEGSQSADIGSLVRTHNGDLFPTDLSICGRPVRT